jgi:phenylacetate-CoA ligase
MQDRIERTFGARVNISYGLDEVGWIAGRCLEGGRYHVHVEHCWVEIVDEQSKPCRPGEYGRLLVTVTSNAMMPLLRYVTDDIVLALDDSPCPCGRTLPAFGEIVGRYSILNRLPPGTMAVVDALRGAMERLPPELSGSQREYQIRQTLDGNFGLRLVLAGPRPEGFDDYIARAFREGLARRGVSGGADPVLTIAEVAAIPRAASAKFFRFVSEFTRPELAKDRVEDPLAVQVTGTPA